MAFQAVPNAAEITLVGEISGQEVVNTFYATHAGSWGLDDLTTLAATVSTWVTGSWLPHQAMNFNFQRVTCRDLRTPIAVEVDDVSAAGVGGVSSNASPMNTTLSIKRGSGFTGRGARGRVFIPPPPLGELLSSIEINHAFADLLAASLNTLREAIELVDWTEVIVSRSGPGSSPAAAVVYTLVEYVIVNYALDSMRRRLAGRGI